MRYRVMVATEWGERSVFASDDRREAVVAYHDRPCGLEVCAYLLDSLTGEALLTRNGFAA